MLRTHQLPWPGVQIGHRVLTTVNDTPRGGGSGARGGGGDAPTRGRGRGTPTAGRGVSHGRGADALGSSPMLGGHGYASPRPVAIEPGVLLTRRSNRTGGPNRGNQ